MKNITYVGLDVHKATVCVNGENGLLLTPSIDHLFDRGFIGFEDNGRLLISPVAHRPSLQRMGVSLGTEEGQSAIEPLLPDVDLLILDNLSTLCTSGSESASDAWVPMQNWLLGLRRKGIAVLLIHHAGTNGRQRGTSRREDALDTVIALRRPEDYSPEQGARFEVHFEKLRNRVEGDNAAPFEARLESVLTDAGEGSRWTAHALQPPIFKQAAELYGQGLSVRQVAASLRISKSEAGRLRLKASDAGLIVDGEQTNPSRQNGHAPILLQG